MNVFNRNVLSVPDKWEFPWYAAWDWAFQMVPMARIDPAFAKDQLILLLREWYMHPNGQLPAYEFAFSDVNPPVHAWACWRVYEITESSGKRDRSFLEAVFEKLLLNFTWWVNREDVTGRQIFSGGFLGMDNIAVFDRDEPRREGGYMEQADATGWMAFYCLTLLTMAMELARDEHSYEDMASKFFNHFIAISDAMNSMGDGGLWDPQDGFYYDVSMIHGQPQQLRVRSLVGLVPLIAVAILDDQFIRQLPGFAGRMRWFLQHRQDLCEQISYMDQCKNGENHLLRLLAIPSRERLQRVLGYLLDENEFLSPYGIRSLSRFHKDHPYAIQLDGKEHRIDYEPGESTTDVFGGNSNWRGPIWFPLNYLLVDALERYHSFYGDDFKVPCPTGSDNRMDLKQVAGEIRKRLCSIFLPDQQGRSPWHGDVDLFCDDPAWKDLVLFNEYYHAETGQGLGASHQTGWTALVALLLEDLQRDQT